MPSLLVTKKMSPELAARVQASVQGRRARPGARLAPRAISLLRTSVFAVVIVAVGWLVLSVRRVSRETESQRSALLERVRRESSVLGPEEHATVSRILPWLALSSGGYEGDMVSEELRAPDAFQKTLSRPTIYVRGPLASFGAASRVGESAAGSFKDAFVLCLLAPPTERTEKLLRKKARIAFGSGGEGMKPAAHVERLYDAIVGLPYLDRDWEERVIQAGSQEELTKLERRFDRAPLPGAKRAAGARLLLFLMDEPGPKGGPTELDGERPHDVRVGLVDLVTKKPLLRLRRHVDPSWLSATTRAELATGVDSCALALEVRKAVSGEGEVAVGQ